jgi:uncharacterized protein
MTSFSLRSVKLRPGEEYHDGKEIQLAPIELGGQRYLPVPETVDAELAITRASTGTLFELRFTGRMHGPCYRCVNETVIDVPISTREYQATNPDESDELRTPYVVDDRLNLSAWARDSIALSLPNKILCRPECAGLCPVCGKDLNVEPHEHEGEADDPRWAALAELRERL